MSLRRPEFEKAYAEAHSMRVEDFAQYRMGDTYRLPMIAKCWRFWQMARVLDMNPQPDVHVAYADGCLVCGKWRAHIGAYGDASPTEWYETREEAIDAAMSKGEQP